jgi:homoserine/homoserine lactone efflux protein
MAVSCLSCLLAAAAVNAVVPGPGMFLAVGRSARRGFRAGAMVTLGFGVAKAALIVAVWAVTTGIVILSDDGLSMLRQFGVGVLAVLALTLLFSAPSGPLAHAGPQTVRRARGWSGDFGGGVAAGLTSPANLVFLLALMPQFVDFAAIRPAGLAAVAAALVTITAIPMLGASALAARARQADLGWAQHLPRIGGAALLCFAAAAAFAVT